MPDAGWRLVEEGADREQLGRGESLFALANGHLGLRGTLDEGEPRVRPGTYLNGFYESYPLEYGEAGFAFADEGQRVVNLPDGKIIRLLVENQPVDIERGTVEHHRRCLDLRRGMLEREMVWRSAHGERIRLTSRRLVSFVQRSVAAIDFTVEALDEPLRVALQSSLVTDRSEGAAGADPRAARELGDVLEAQFSGGRELRAGLGFTTRRSGLHVVCGMDHTIDAPEDARITADVAAAHARVTASARLEAGQALRVQKVLAYHWSSRQTVDWLRDQVDASLENALAEGWDGLAYQQRAYLDAWWQRAAIDLDGDAEVQQALRVALFHLLQAGARIEGQPIAAKGLTGAGYDGHAFWDTEAYVLPVLTYLEPRIVRDALAWRHEILPYGRELADKLGLQGALLPWRTIHGEECSAYWPAGLAAVHVNAAVADATARYVRATGDAEFERELGVELLVDTARVWCRLGSFNSDGHFRIAGVTGPDEYSALMDDNVYTNVMAQRNLRHAIAAVGRHRHACEVGEDELRAWARAADAMHIPYDERIAVHPQHAGFLELADWPFEAMAPADYPLLLSHSYFQLYRSRVVKQADLVLALWFAGDVFDAGDKRRDFDYYEPLTVRDSSLSAAAQSVMAAEVGHTELAWQYLREAALTDLRDLHHNVHSGLHMASLAGAVLAATAGLGGFRDHTGEYRFRPRLPAAVSRLCFRLVIRGSRLRVDIDGARARYVVESGDALELFHYDEPLTADADGVRRAIPDAPDVGDPPSQPPHREPGRGLP